jgi:hypothetical protein
VFVAGLTATYSPGVHGSPTKVKLPTATFTAVALSPDRPRTLVFWHEPKKLARAVLVRDSDTSPLTVRLEPLAASTGRLLDAEGRPQAGSKVQARYSSRQRSTLPGELSPFGEGLIPAALPLCEATTDRDGRFRLQGLIPGMKYDLVIVGDSGLVTDLAEDVDFPPGDAKELGDVKARSKPRKEKKEEP